MGFGFASSFFSSFGQTFFISLFVPFLLADLALSAGSFGALYSGATLGSALLLPYLGALYDRCSLRRYSLAIVAGLGAACLLMASAVHVVLLWLGLWGLRMTGQGLLTHLSMTTMARTPEGARGKAIGIASLGFPAGEAILPPVAALLIAGIGWRSTWLAAAAFTALVLLPLVTVLSRPIGTEDSLVSASEVRRGRAAWWLFRSPPFLCVLPSILALASISTGIFLYQIPMADEKGWQPEWVASGFILFAAVRAVTSVLAGNWLDRVGALRLLPLSLFPFGCGLAFLAASDAPAIIPVYLGLFGMTFGLSGVVTTAVWVDFYGTAELGAIRSMLAMWITLGTAASPVIMGRLLDIDIPFAVLIVSALVIVIAATIPLFFADRLRRPSDTQEGTSRESEA